MIYHRCPSKLALWMSNTNKSFLKLGKQTQNGSNFAFTTSLIEEESGYRLQRKDFNVSHHFVTLLNYAGI